MLVLILSLSSLITATLSAVFGMVGGSLLMGVYAALLPVPSAMVMHGATQLVSNVSRALLLWRSVFWPGIWMYVLGALLSFAALCTVHYVPPQSWVFLGLGSTPFIAALLPARWFDFERPGAALLTGSVVAAVQLTAGAAGPLLDIAFVDSRLQREQVIATKAVTQCFSHALKLVYFAPAIRSCDVPLELIGAVFLATVVGTKLGTIVLEQLTDESFRRYSRAIIYTVSVVYLGRATVLLW